MKEPCAVGRPLSGPLWAAACCLLAAFGCHAPPAQPSATDACHPYCSRTALLARQVAADSAVELAEHPLRVGRNVVVESSEHLVAIGAGLYSKRWCLGCQCAPEPLGPCLPPDGAGLASPGPPDDSYHTSHFDLYPDPGPALMALRTVIDQAADHIDILMFLWENDEVGMTVARWLTERAAAGVHVRILVDGGGNLIFSSFQQGVDVNGAICELLKQPNVEVLRIRNPFCRFDHRKLVVADGCVAWSGGRNLTHKSFFGQRDLSFTVVGRLVDDLQHVFDEAWHEQGGEPPVHAGPPAPHATCLDGPANAWAHLIQTGPAGHNLATPLYKAVDSAHRTVYLENGYLSDPRLVCKLAAARRRGVDVRVVLTLTSHESIVDFANRVTANRLLRAGVRVYICPRMTHVKAGAVDGCWAYLGTGNYDALSLRHNCEFGLIVGGALVDELEGRLFQEDFCTEWELKQPLSTTWLDYFSEVVMCLYL